MRTISINSNNDIFMTGRNLAMSAGIYAVQDVCKNVMQGVRGEMIFAQEAGLPYFETVFSSARNLPVFIAEAKKALLSVANVQSLKSFNATQANNDLSYTAEIVTTFGTGAINA